MDIYRKENIRGEKESSNKSSVEAETTANITAKKDVVIKASDVKAKETNISGENVNVTSAANNTKVEGETSKVTINVNAGNDKMSNTLTAGGKVLVVKNQESEKSVNHEGSSIEAEKVNITANNDVAINGSKVKGEDVNITAGGKVDITGDKNKTEVNIERDSLLFTGRVNLSEKTTTLIKTANSIVNVVDNAGTYATSQFAAYEKGKDIKNDLKNNYNELKKIYNALKENNLKPEDLGLSLTATGEIEYNKQFINKLVEKIDKSVVEGTKNVSITAHDLNMISSEIKGGNVVLTADSIKIKSDIEKTSDHTNTIGAKVSGTHNLVTKEGSIDVSGYTANKGVVEKTNVISTVEGNNVNINSEKLTLEGGKVKGDNVTVNTDELNKHHKADSRFEYVANAEAGNKKVEGTGKVSYNKEIKNESTIEGKNVTVNANKETTTKDSTASINANLTAGANLDKDRHIDGYNISGGASTVQNVEVGGVKTKVELGGTGSVAIDKDGKVKEYTGYGTAKGDINYKNPSGTEGTAILDLKVGSNNGKVDVGATAKAKVVVPYGYNDGAVSGKIELGGDTTIKADENGVNNFDLNGSVGGELNLNTSSTAKPEANPVVNSTPNTTERTNTNTVATSNNTPEAKPAAPVVKETKNLAANKPTNTPAKSNENTDIYKPKRYYGGRRIVEENNSDEEIARYLELKILELLLLNGKF